MAKNQPEKLAAFEARYVTRSNAPLSLLGWVDEKNERFLFNVEIPGMLSFLAFNNTHATVTGLDAYAPEDRPPQDGAQAITRRNPQWPATARSTSPRAST